MNSEVIVNIEDIKKHLNDTDININPFIEREK